MAPAEGYVFADNRRKERIGKGPYLTRELRSMGCATPGQRSERGIECEDLPTSMLPRDRGA